jgi:dTDP-4-dehydrorhamnose reductase
MQDSIRVLVTGGNGQLGQSLRKTMPSAMIADFPSRADLDVTDHAALERFIGAKSPDYVVNAAAYTKVDQAETDKHAAFSGNATAVQILAAICKSKNIPIVHISTDFLFHGAFNRPIDETAPTAPLGIYALSKEAGEKYLDDSGLGSIVIRTSWLYSEFGTNFLKTMLRLSGTHPKLNVIADQHGSPTYAGDLANAIWHMIGQLGKAPDLKGTQYYHFSNYGVTTWYDFATAIMELSGNSIPVIPILTHEYPVSTPRPAYSALWPRKFSQDFSWENRHWRVALKDALTALEQLPEEKQ